MIKGSIRAGLSWHVTMELHIWDEDCFMSGWDTDCVGPVGVPAVHATPSSFGIVAVGVGRARCRTGLLLLPIVA